MSDSEPMLRSGLVDLDTGFYRIVESQEEIATTELVDDLSEQDLLENLLEQSKPPLPKGTEGFHYLLATPFRYPPLRYGSRFGHFFERSLLYGGMTVETTLTEAAYYRCLFIDGPETPFPDVLRTQHLLFTTGVKTGRGMRLQGPEWQEAHRDLADPQDYRYCQAVGTAMRDSGVVAFQFISARALQTGLCVLPFESANATEGVNVAVFSPEGLESKTPGAGHRVIMTTDPGRVMASLQESDGNKRVFSFQRDLFLINGNLPRPAA